MPVNEQAGLFLHLRYQCAELYPCMWSPQSSRCLNALLATEVRENARCSALWLSQRITLDLKPFIVLQIILQPTYTCAMGALSLIIEIAFVKINEQCTFPRCSGLKICRLRNCRELVNSVSVLVPLSRLPDLPSPPPLWLNALFCPSQNETNKCERSIRTFRWSAQKTV